MESKIHLNNDLVLVNNQLNSYQEIEDRIFIIRGVQVMIDRDLADIYEVKTKRLNEQVKRNIERFPERFMFQLSDNESDKLVANCDRFKTLKHSSSNPYAFTEQGVSMLASVLNSEAAVQKSIKIIDAFVAMRRFIQSNAKLFIELDHLRKEVSETNAHLQENDRKIEHILTIMDKYKIEDRQKLFFDGQIYDAFTFMVSLVQKAEKEIILIDNYAGVGTLDVLSKKKDNVDVQLFTSKKAKIAQSDIDKFNAQYPTITLNYTETFHDRFLIIDSSTAYSIGSSVKDAGKRCFAVTQIYEKWMVKMILERL
ncbi:MAG: ORF6N domain-containing protein [Bacteroidales bacterium]|nr:ORF6N domain-containing protein [Bacteroidales bacterium]